MSLSRLLVKLVHFAPRNMDPDTAGKEQMKDVYFVLTSHQKGEIHKDMYTKNPRR